MHLLLRLYIYLHLPRLCCKTTHLVCFIYIYGVSAATAALRLLKNDSFTKEPPAAKLSICTYGSTPAGKLFVSCIYSSVATPLYSSAFTSPLLLLKNDSSLIHIVVPKWFICILYVYTTVYVVVPKRLRRIPSYVCPTRKGCICTYGCPTRKRCTYIYAPAWKWRCCAARLSQYWSSKNNAFINRGIILNKNIMIMWCISVGASVPLFTASIASSMDERKII